MANPGISWVGPSKKTVKTVKRKTSQLVELSVAEPSKENKINWENSQKEQWFKSRTQVQAGMQPSAYRTEGTMAAKESRNSGNRAR